MTVNTVRRHDVQIAYETFGPTSAEPLLLVMGTGGQMLAWHPDFCAALVDRGFQVVRFDNRDSGLSTSFSEKGPPSQLKMLFRPASAAVYRLEDMADDAVAVIDAQGWASPHVVGMSQGGMIAQVMATRHPDRVRTLTSISSEPAPRIGQPRLWTLLGVAKVVKKPITDAKSLGQQMIDLQGLVGSPDYPADPEWLRELGRQCYERGYDLAAIQRQTAAIAASGDRHKQLSELRVPALVIHGEADRLVRPIAGGKPRRPSRVPNSSPFPAWATTYLANCGRPSSTTSTSWSNAPRLIDSRPSGGSPLQRVADTDRDVDPPHLDGPLPTLRAQRSQP